MRVVGLVPLPRNNMRYIQNTNHSRGYKLMFMDGINID
jgi:hypothetical protein